jgi:Protein of unknown function (DUF3667)
MSKHRKRAHHPEGHLHTCPTCQHQYKGNYCNNCGEKIFHPHDLSLAHLLEDAVDKFTHFDLKIPKSILLLFNPGYLTEKFLKGIRKPFANPIQLFLIANVIFFLFYKMVPFSDFTPSWGDHHYFKLSEYKILTWAKPLDDKIEDLFDKKVDTKWAKIAEKIPIDASKVIIVDSILQHTLDTSTQPKVVLFDAVVKGSSQKIKIDETYESQINMDFYHEMQKNSAAYSKSLIFLLILLVAPFIYLFYRKSFQNIGTALIFATHFVSFYIIYFGLNSLLIIKYDWGLCEPFSWIYDATKGTVWRGVLRFVGGDRFEFNSLVLLMAYLFIAFRRLLKPNWVYNLLASYCISRIFFFLCFGVYKKIILWIAVSNY